MNNALIGYSGFVGSTLMKQATFESTFRSTTIQQIEGRTFDTVVCAGVAAQKWIANKEPQADIDNINRLIGHLKTIKCNTFVLISTVDVFKNPITVDENSTVDENDLHPYGLNRRWLEKFVEAHFENYLIVRLPGLVGPGLRKNIIFDFLNDNDIHKIDTRNVFQFYPMVNLWPDIQRALSNQLNLIHLTAEPITVAKVARECFNKAFENHLPAPIVKYDMRTRYANLFQKEGNYQYSEHEALLAIRAYAQSEVKSVNKE